MSILCSDLEILSTIYTENELEIKSNNTFNMQFNPYIGNLENMAFVTLTAQFIIPPDYPNNPPKVTILMQRGFDEDQVNLIVKQINQK